MANGRFADRRSWLWGAVAAVVAAWALAGAQSAIAPSAFAQDGASAARVARLAKVKSWTYQLQRLDDISLHSQRSDLVVVDYSLDGSEPRELWPVQIEQFKDQSGGQSGAQSSAGRRIVLAYLSIGEAEDYRFYWPAAWDARRPDWLLPESCRWPGNHVVQYWRRDWRELIYAAPYSYLGRIQRAGFDGVYLDRIDAWQQLQPRFPKARAEMVGFVRELARVARARDPGFLIVAQNAEEMLTDRAYRSAIDAVAKEDLLYGLVGEGRRNAAGDIRASVDLLRRLTADGKPVLTVEYLSVPSLVEQVRRQHRQLGFVPSFAARQLDGGAPAAPPGPGTPVAAPDCRKD